MATPVLRALRATRPAARLVAVCRPGLDQLLAGVPWIDELLVGETKRTLGVLAMARRLRGVDAALLLPNTVRAALLARLARIPVRVGYRRYGRGPLLSHALGPPDERPIAAVDYYARLAASALGLSEIDTRLELGLTDTQRQEARRLLEGVPRPFAMLCPGANRIDKRWPAERFGAVADALAERRGLASVVTGGPGETGVAAAVAAAARQSVVDLTARNVTLGGLKAVAAEAAVAITNDTGPRHLAAAMGTPVVCLYGPTDRRWTTLHGSVEHPLVAEPFLPGDLVADDHRAACAITRIAVGDVIAATEALLDAAADPVPAGPREAPASTRPA